MDRSDLPPKGRAWLDAFERGDPATMHRLLREQLEEDRATHERERRSETRYVYGIAIAAFVAIVTTRLLEWWFP